MPLHEATIRRRSGVAGAVDFPRLSPNRNCLFACSLFWYRIRGLEWDSCERQSVPWQRRAVVCAVLFARCGSGAQQLLWRVLVPQGAFFERSAIINNPFLDLQKMGQPVFCSSEKCTM